MPEIAKYLYGIIPCPEERTFAITGMGDPGGPVHSISERGIAMVVSDTLLKQYEGTRKNMMAHEKVLEAVMTDFTLLPVRFGTVANSASPTEDIRRLLSSRSEEFRKMLQEMEGKTELGLKAFWRDEKAVFEEILASNPDIKRLRDSLAGKPPDATHFERIRLGEKVSEALARKRGQEAAAILEPLRPIASRLRENEVALDRIILNAAFLVDRRREAEFDEAVKKLDEQMSQRVTFKYVGPVPPYNFVNIVVNWKELKG